jgi:hypothetical protein
MGTEAELQKVAMVTESAWRPSKRHDFSSEMQRKAVLDFLNGGNWTLTERMAQPPRKRHR